jgi:hypothetical protein
MAKVLNLKIDQAATFSRQLTALTDFEIVSKIKKLFVSYVAYEFNITIDDAVNGLFTISLTPEEAANIPASRHVFDILIKDSLGVTTRIFEGNINVIPAVTDANPFVVLEGIKVSDPNLVHAHDNKEEFLDLIQSTSWLNQPWELVDTDLFEASNSGRYMVDTDGGVINIIVPDAPESDYEFSFKVMDLKDTFGLNKCVIKNESDDLIYEGTVNGEDFEIVWTDATNGYKIIQ